jgi:hypothetical protein
MAYSLAVMIAAQQSFLDLLSAGTGTAGLVLLDGVTELATIPIDHAASSVSEVDGSLSLVQGTGGTIAIATGTVTVAQLLDRDGAAMDDAIAVEAGTSAVSGKVVLSSLSVISGVQIDLISLVIG